MTRHFRTITRATLPFLLVLISGILSSPAHAQETIKIGGTGTGLGTMHLIIAAFEKENPYLKIKLMPSIGSSGAIKATAEGAMDIGLIGRPLKEDEAKLGLTVIEYAKTPFLFVVQNKVPVSDLSLEEIVKIYKGETLTWPNGERVRLVLRPATDADTVFARTVSPEMNTALDSALSRQGMLMGLTNQENNDLIDKTPGSIGFSSLTQIVTEHHEVKALTINGIAPGTKGIVNKKYPFMRTLALLIKPSPSPSVRRFIDFMYSPTGEGILKKTGNVPIPVKTGK